MAKMLLTVLTVMAALISSALAVTDVDILNFALNLECLEASYYSWAAYGKGLSLADRGGGPASVGGKKALLSADAQAYAEDIATDEIAHVRFLRAALGASAVACPAIDIGKAFNLAALAAFNLTKLPVTFSPYGEDTTFFHGAFIFEDVGVTAYKGAARLIVNKDYLEAAAGILAVEAYHAGAVRSKLYALADMYVFPYGATVGTIIGATSALRGAVGGGKDENIVDAKGGIQIAPTDANAIAFSRSTKEVLAIVYLGGSKRGGFFPKGLNGVIR